jgi:hypothetical protein
MYGLVALVNEIGRSRNFRQRGYVGARSVFLDEDGKDKCEREGSEFQARSRRCRGACFEGYARAGLTPSKLNSPTDYGRPVQYSTTSLRNELPIRPLEVPEINVGTPQQQCTKSISRRSITSRRTTRMI